MLTSHSRDDLLISSHDVAAALAKPARLDALERTRLLDSEPEEAFDRAVRLATRALDAPVALMSLVTPERQFFKAQEGLDEPWATRRETPLTHSFCQYVVATRGALVVNDAERDPLVRDNPAITDLGMRAYLGVPLKEPSGEVLGALCAIDRDPRTWHDADLDALNDVAASLGTELALRLRVEALRQCEARLEGKHAETMRLSRELRHRAGNLLAVVTAIMNLSARMSPDVPAALAGLADRVAALSRAHMACSDDDPDGASLHVLVRSVLGPANEWVALQASPYVRLPDECVTSLGLVLHSWTNEAQRVGGRFELAWRQEGGTLVLRRTQQGEASEPTGIDAVIVDAAIQQLEGTLAHERREGAHVTMLTVPAKRAPEAGPVRTRRSVRDLTHPPLGPSMKVKRAR